MKRARQVSGLLVLLAVACGPSRAEQAGVQAPALSGVGSTPLTTTNTSAGPGPGTGTGRDSRESSEDLHSDTPPDEWTLDLGRPMPDVVGESPSLDGPPLEGLSPRCRTLYIRFAQKLRGQFSFVCAVSPSGDAWASVGSLSLPPDQATQVVAGTWQLFVERAGKVMRSAPQHFQLFAGHSGGACQTDPAPCVQYGHYAGLLGPRGFAFLRVGSGGAAQALAIGHEEINTDTPPELSLTSWRVGSSLVELDGLSQHVAIASFADCNGDKRPELAVNPYRVAGDSFKLRFDAHARATSELWTLLLEQEADGSWSDDDDISRRYAARLCPGPPGRPFEVRGKRWPASLHCAKIWGQSTASLHAALDAACKKPRDDEATAACQANRKTLEHMIDTKVPSLLPAPPSAPLPRGCFDNAMANGERASCAIHNDLLAFGRSAAC